MCNWDRHSSVLLNLDVPVPFQSDMRLTSFMLAPQMLWRMLIFQMGGSRAYSSQQSVSSA